MICSASHFREVCDAEIANRTKLRRKLFESNTEVSELFVLIEEAASKGISKIERTLLTGSISTEEFKASMSELGFKVGTTDTGNSYADFTISW